MTSAAMHLIGDDKGGLPEKRMERIGDDNLAAQTPGIMTSRRTKAEKTGRSSPRLSKPASFAASIRKPISPTPSPRSSTAILTARSTISCRGLTRSRSRSGTWPENTAYAGSTGSADFVVVRFFHRRLARGLNG